MRKAGLPVRSAYQTPITIEDVLERVHRHDDVLPATARLA